MSSDLIKRSAVIKIIENEMKEKLSYAEHNAQINILFKVKEMPAGYDVDKVMEQLEEMRDTITHNISLNSQGENVDEEILNEISHYQKIIDIVKSGGIE